jgi:hypothetical protein
MLYSSLLHRLVSSVYYSLQWRFPGNGFNTRTITVSLNYTLQISLYYSTHKAFPSQPPACLPTINSGTRLTLLITFRHEPHRKLCFHCYSPKIPRPLQREPVYRSVAKGWPGVLLTSLRAVTKQCMFLVIVASQQLYTLQYCHVYR